MHWPLKLKILSSLLSVFTQRYSEPKRTSHSGTNKSILCSSAFQLFVALHFISLELN